MPLKFLNTPVPPVLVSFARRANIPTTRLRYYIIAILILIILTQFIPLASGQTQPLPTDQTVRIRTIAPPEPGPAIPVFPIDPNEKATSHSWDYQQQQKKKGPTAPSNPRIIQPEVKP